MIYIVRVASKQERVVAMMLEKKAKTNGLNVYSIFIPESIKGYIFVEVDEENTVLNLINGVKYVKGILKSVVDIEQIRNMVKVEEKPEEEIKVGDIVEITSGPFKGENAKVTQIDETKKEYVVLPLEVAISLPIKLKSSHLKLVKKAEE